MDRVARSSLRDRADLFRRAATVLSPERSPLIVDLSLSRRDLGFADDHDPEQRGIGKNEIRRRIESLVVACKENIRDHFVPKLRADFAGVLGNEGWSAELDEVDPQTVIFTYPSAGIDDAMERYIRPSIRLEMGARSDDWPAADHDIKPYAAEAFPEAFTVASICHVRTLGAERTFWEKATILHKEYHRPRSEPTRERVSRHYYDLYQLSKNDIAKKALQQIELLERVVEHKKVFFRSSWAHYETAKPGSFRLVPPAERIAVLRADYAQMQSMIFGEYPEWAKIIKGLGELEEKINSMRGPGNW